jgi:hypothetical protein
MVFSMNLDAAPGGRASGTLDAFENGDGSTTLRARMGTIDVHPWRLYPDFDCTGVPVADSQLAVALPDIELGTAEEIVDSAYFAEALAVVVFASPDDENVVACGVLPPLPWVVDEPPSSAPSGQPQGQSPRPASNAQATQAIAALVDEMEAAVTSGDRDAYLALVDLSDPVFATEHARLADDWDANPPTEYELAVSDVVVDGASATGMRNTTWAAEDQDIRSAMPGVRFTRAADGAWRFAGELWITEKVEHFRVHVAPGLESEIGAITEALPDIYEYATTSIEWQPTRDMELKLYSGPAELVSTVRLGLPDIHGWNEPGESLKLRPDPEVPSLTPAIAHEFTHFLEFDRSGTQRSLMPWWLSEGIASLIGYHFEDPELGEFQLQRVRDWAANGELAEWDDMAVFETTPMELWPNAYAQGYALAVFVTETYDQRRRNAWLAGMSVDMEIDQATEVVFEVSFEELDSAFVDWLADEN